MPTMTTIIFYLTAALAVGSALLVITRRNAVYSALFLVVTFFCIAVLYILLNAQFIAAVQVIVYAGAIMVLFLFVIMLLNAGEALEGVSAKIVVRRIVGGLFGLLLLTQIAAILFTLQGSNAVKGYMTQDIVARTGSTQIVGLALFSQYIYPFEAVSVLLLIAIIGSVMLAKRKL